MRRANVARWRLLRFPARSLSRTSWSAARRVALSLSFGGVVDCSVIKSSSSLGHGKATPKARVDSIDKLMPAILAKIVHPLEAAQRLRDIAFLQTHRDDIDVIWQ